MNLGWNNTFCDYDDGLCIYICVLFLFPISKFGTSLCTK